jgi:ankyrin repeat protein
MVSADEADDLLYCARTGEVDDLKAWIDEKVQQESFPQLMTEIAAANEAENTLLHFAAANGHTSEKREEV